MPIDLPVLLPLSARAIPAAPPPGFHAGLRRPHAGHLSSLPHVAGRPRPAAQPETSEQAALQYLVSAACYLRFSRRGTDAAVLKTAGLLTDLSEQVTREALARGFNLDAAVYRAWTDKQMKWEQYRSFKAAAYRLQRAPELRFAAVPKAPASLWGRLWKALREPAQVQPF